MGTMHDPHQMRTTHLITSSQCYTIVVFGAPRFSNVIEDV